MAHLKRYKAPKNWPVKRKGTTFLVIPASNTSKGVPVLIALRNVLKIAQNRKEVKKAIYLKNLLLNNKPVRDERQAMVLFDILTIPLMKKNYRMTLAENGKFAFEEVSEKEASKKVAKVIDKKILKGKKVQLNLSDGRNYLSNIKCKTNDSALIDLKSNKIEKFIELKEKSKVFIFSGKHTGSSGEIEKLKPERKMASVNTNKGKVNVLIKQLMAIE